MGTIINSTFLGVFKPGWMIFVLFYTQFSDNSFLNPQKKTVCATWITVSKYSQIYVLIEGSFWVTRCFKQLDKNKAHNATLFRQPGPKL